MAYATITDVAARNAARGTYSANTQPTASQVAGFIYDSAAQLDTWLYGMGYNAPFDAAIASGLVPTMGQQLLRRWNTTGAALMVEESAVTPMGLASYQRMWDEIKLAVQNREMDLPLPTLPSKANPRQSQPPATQQFTFDINPNVGNRGSWDL